MLASGRKTRRIRAETETHCPGTVVDRRITTVYDFDFYLQAHDEIKGHVRPTHYTIIYDKWAHTPRVTYMPAATKAVGLVPLTHYTDLACKRVWYYLDGFLNSEQLSVPGSSSRKGEGKGKGKGKAWRQTKGRQAEQRIYDAALQAWGKGVHPNLKETTFYI
ncbi:uncharacterized protein F5891DRAFT_1251895 [Suillus fuscotomentosus]|uniref:Piwi domain-containing protein n=1 Tax=Suillus fuscotomentosus TaxID=1912939 RepID=A0AAD4DWI5_9AGAM|nr:uncharacterized protein F5891DRAFT_1251895 [Suillus fuscotomentosus]KAG1895419.1 hypothetical protein F5891DRAFT_1251895 [Suillus fuscotomentosus]